MRSNPRKWLPAAAMVVAMVTTGCGDLFDVKNPGRILDVDLNNPKGIESLVRGMSSDFSASYDGLAFGVARLGDEMAGSGSYNSTGLLRRGIINAEDADGYWAGAQRARWVAEAGLERMQAVDDYQFDNNPLTARAYLFAGLANRWLGETFCQVVYDGGSPEPKSAAFNRAIPHFQNAVTHGDTEIQTAARGGLAQVYMGLGDWAKATQASSQVPTSFVYVAVYSDNSGREENEIVQETHGRFEMSAFGALAGSFAPPDPRAPYTDCRTSPDCPNAQGADGQTPHLRQEKYPELGSDIPLVKGTDMRLIEAEAALVANDLNGAMAKINEVRNFFDLGPLTATAVGSGPTGDPSSMTGWDILDRERHLTLWLEGRRLFDLHRWDHPFLDGGSIAGYEPLGRRASCMPIADSECQTNTNVQC